MAIIEYIMGNTAMAEIACEIDNQEQKYTNLFLKSFGEELKKIARINNVKLIELDIFKATFLLVAKDDKNYNFVFAMRSGYDKVVYKNFDSVPDLNIQKICNQVEYEIGQVVSAFSLPITAIIVENIEDEAKNFANGYLKATLENNRNNQLKKDSPAEIIRGLELLKNDYPDKKIAFIIMQFEKSRLHNELIISIKETLEKYGIIALRADDKEYSDDLFTNVKTYMHASNFGIAIFERITEEDFNPNVSLEVGYMMGINKNVCFLKDKTLKKLQSDLAGKLYKEFDPQDIINTLPLQLEKWMLDKGIIQEIKAKL